MSRAFTPPESLSGDEIKTIASVRRDIWTSALQGLCTGTFCGYATHTIAKFGHSRRAWKMPFLNRNTVFLSVFLGGALGSFVMASTTGKNEVHKLHPVFQVGAKNKAYEESLELAKQIEKDILLLESRKLPLSPDEQEVAERLRRQTNRLYRRATLSQSLSNEGGGLSDSHGGHWMEDSNP